MRKTLINAAQYILGHFGEKCDLGTTGERISARGGKIAKNKAVVAVARKLAVMMHHLWKTKEEYHPFQKSGDCEVQAEVRTSNPCLCKIRAKESSTFCGQYCAPGWSP